jgi:two-component system cell cycle response regulator DivK
MVLLELVGKNRPRRTLNSNNSVKSGDDRGTKSKKRVLIVEDDEMSRQLLVDILGSYDTSQTGDPLLAFELLRKDDFDLIILDIRLPHVSGLELARWIKEDEQLRNGGCDVYISKPINVMGLLETVQHIIGDPTIEVRLRRR